MCRERYSVVYQYCNKKTPNHDFCSNCSQNLSKNVENIAAMDRLVESIESQVNEKVFKFHDLRLDKFVRSVVYSLFNHIHSEIHVVLSTIWLWLMTTFAFNDFFKWSELEKNIRKIFFPASNLKIIFLLFIFYSQSYNSITKLGKPGLFVNLSEVK